MSTLVLASSNPGKILEFSQLLSAWAIDVYPQSEWAVPEVAETGLSFVENALIKARHASRHAGLPALADDSGLVVDRLNGAPGLYSARYAGADADDAANRRKLLAALADVPDTARSARFVCVLALVRHPDDPLPLICQGEWAGRIAHAESGEHGFGYDALFELPERHCTAAELAPSEKQRLSHRAQALQQLQQRLTHNPYLLAPVTAPEHRPDMH